MLLPLLGLLAGVKPRMKLLALVIPYYGCLHWPFRTLRTLMYDMTLFLALTLLT